MNVPKVFLLGLDGATWKLLDRFVAEGVMPNLGRLTREGARGILNSTIPDVTPVAWTSMLTGVNPSKHGIFGYHTMENRDGVILGPLASRAKVKSPMVFDIYGQLGKTIVSINMPMTYPPREEDGVIITGMMTPSKESRYYLPTGLMDELRSQGIDYKIDITLTGDQDADFEQRIAAYLANGAGQFFDDLRGVTEEREKTVMYLLRTKPWDLFMVNFVSLDRIQHYHWRDFWASEGDEVAVGRTREHCRYLDSIIGKIYSEIRDKAVLVVCSDHGFGDYCGNFYLDVWLKQTGFCVDRGDRMAPALVLKRMLKRMGFHGPIKRAIQRSAQQTAKRLIYMAATDIDWKRTRAYVYSLNGIRINLKGRDQFGVVKPGREFAALRNEIKRQLLETRDERGEKIVKAVHFVEELYGRLDPEQSPDIMFEFDDGHDYTTYYGIKGKTAALDRGFPWRKGDHRRDGIVLLAGEGVIPRKQVAADIEDILPTVLFIQNLPLADYFDGRVLSEVFAEDFARDRQAGVKRSFERGRVDASEAEVDQEVIDRLRGLGYI